MSIDAQTPFEPHGRGPWARNGLPSCFVSKSSSLLKLKVSNKLGAIQFGHRVPTLRRRYGIVLPYRPEMANSRSLSGEHWLEILCVTKVGSGDGRTPSG
jgi:hypothetical protein